MTGLPLASMPSVRTFTCANPAKWHPTLHVVQEHHHPPKAWRIVLLQVDPGTDQSWWRVIPLCGLCHDEYHTLLNAFVHAGGKPPKSVTKTYSPFLLALAVETWAHRPGDKPPYTIAAGLGVGAVP